MADYLIIGAGSAGCVLADRLSADPEVRVTVLEAGGRDHGMEVRIPAATTKMFQSGRDWAYWTVPQPELDDRRIFWPRGKMLGGSSSMNHQVYIRGHRADYDDWAAAGCPGWSYEEVLPLFRRSECNQRGASALHGGDGPLHVGDLRDPNPLSLAFVDAAAAAGIERLDDLCDPDLGGVGLTQVTQHRGRRWSTADAFLHPAAKRPNLTVETEAHVARIRLDDQGRARGVELRDGRAVDADTVICCAGAVNTPQLLLCSGIGPREELADHSIDCLLDLPGVGANLQDHLGYAVFCDVDTTRTLASAEKPAALLNYLLRKRGLLSSNGAEAIGFARSDGGDGPPDLEILFLPVPYENQGIGTPDRHAFSLVIELLTPASRGRIGLDPANRHAAPRIDPAYLSDPGGHDLDRLLAGFELAERILEQRPLSERITHRPPIDDRTGYIRSVAQTIYHPTGTCRMGTDDDAVVDPELRVRGAENLLIADVSVMPAVNRGHTNAPAIMIGERCADLLID